MNDNLQAFAKDLFNKKCKEQIGLSSMEDDELILDAIIRFNTYIKTFKRLDYTVPWHLVFIKTLVDVKVDALSKRIIKNYGTHEKYINRVRRRYPFGGREVKEDSSRKKRKIRFFNYKGGEGNGRQEN